MESYPFPLPQHQRYPAVQSSCEDEYCLKKMLLCDQMCRCLHKPPFKCVCAVRKLQNQIDQVRERD